MSLWTYLLVAYCILAEDSSGYEFEFNAYAFDSKTVLHCHPIINYRLNYFKSKKIYHT